MNKILTVVVPTYNMQAYLEQCLDSFIFEGMEEIEVLIVNDGSKDNSASIAQKYVDKHPKVFKLLNKENGGHGSTINSGIKLATGKYFKVVDADDWVSTENLAKLINFLNTTDVDIVYNTYFEQRMESGTTYHVQKMDLEPEQVFDYREVLNRYMLVMHKITIKTSILRDNNITLSENSFYVDAQYVVFPISFIKTGCFLPYPIYNYRLERKDQSMSPEKVFKLFHQREHVFLSIIESIESNKNQLGDSYKKIATAVSSYIAYFYGSVFAYYETKQQLKMLKELHKKIKTEHPSFYKCIKFPKRIKFIIFLRFHFIKPLRFIQGLFVKDVRKIKHK